MAFMAVFVSHTFPPDPAYYSARHIPCAHLAAATIRAGRFGVDLFFLLSAYLITELLLREKERLGQIHLQSFYLRRVLRIWPLYFFAVLIAALLPLVDPRQFFPPKYVVAFLLLSGNLLTSFGASPISVMSPLWSVSLEEQFYLLWPAVISRARRRRTLLLTAAAFFVAAELGRLLLLRFGLYSAIWENTVARLDPLALGVATAVLVREKRFHSGWPLRLACLLAGGVVWVVAGDYFSASTRFSLFGYPAIALGAWLIFLSALGVAVAPRWLRYLGKISYGLYVFHMLAWYWVCRLGGTVHNLRDYAIRWCAGLLLTLVMAALSYRFLESPFLLIKERFAYIKSRPV